MCLRCSLVISCPQTARSPPSRTVTFHFPSPSVVCLPVRPEDPQGRNQTGGFLSAALGLAQHSRILLQLELTSVQAAWKLAQDRD